MFSFECGGRTYAIGPNGTVIAGDSARSRFELRVTDRSSDDAVGTMPTGWSSAIATPTTASI